MQDAPAAAVLGFRPHTYWTAAAALAGPSEVPRVIARRRIDFAEGLERFAYHQAAEMDLDKAQPFLDRTRALVEAKAAQGMGELLAELRTQGLAIRDAVVPAGTAKVPDRLEDILLVHARIHAAEGEFYRDAVASACTAAGLRVRRAAERELPALVCARLAIEPADLDARLRQMGAALGPPWGGDYRLAVLAAWTRL